LKALAFQNPQNALHFVGSKKKEDNKIINRIIYEQKTYMKNIPKCDIFVVILRIKKPFKMMNCLKFPYK